MPRAPLRQSASGVADLRAHGCMLFSSLWLAGWATDGNAIPNGQDAIDSTVVGLRKGAGMTIDQFRDRGTTLDEAERAFEGLSVAGYMPLRMRKMHGGSLRNDVLPELRKGNAAIVAVNYGVLQDAGKAAPGTVFRGGHALVILNLDNGKVDVIDPLRSEVVRLPADLIERAMETFGKNPWRNGRGEAGIVSKVQTWKEGYQEAKADLVQATKKLESAVLGRDLARTTADELSGLLQAANIALAECRNATPPDCTTAIQQERDRVKAAAIAAVEAVE